MRRLFREKVREIRDATIFIPGELIYSALSGWEYKKRRAISAQSMPGLCVRINGCRFICEVFRFVLLSVSVLSSAFWFDYLSIILSNRKPAKSEACHAVRPHYFTRSYAVERGKL